MLVTVFLAVSCSNKNDEIVKRTTIAMGTTVEIQIAGLNEGEANAAIDFAFDEFKRIDTMFSTYIEGNNVAKINNDEGSIISVNDETYFMLKECGRFNKITSGAFDAVAGNLIDLIGFEKGKPGMPGEQAVKNALIKVGWKNVELLNDNKVKKLHTVKFNFGAVAKGYGVDRASAVLDKLGIEKYLVNAGGEIEAKGKDWKIGIQHPRERNQILGTLIINGKSVATSGDYEQYFKNRGKRYSHVLNPLTGYPVDECEAVTIIADDDLTADALATGVFVLGLEKGMKLIESLPEIEGLIVDTTGNVKMSSGFGKYFTRM